MKKQLVIVLAILLVGCGGGGGDGTPQNGGSFTQADVAGTWDVIQFNTGNAPGWMFATALADSSGNLSASYLLTSDGPYPGPYPVDMQFRLAIDGNGIMSAYDTSVVPAMLEGAFHGTMSSHKNLFVATDNDFTAPEPPTYAMIVARKRGGVSYTNGDFRGKSFVYHSLYSGSSTVWEYGYGSVDASGRVSQDNAYDPFHLSGDVPGYPLLNFVTTSVDSDGVVTDNTGTMHGMMSADKSTVFAVITNEFVPPRYQFMVSTILGAAYTQADLGGNWWYHSLNYLAWSRGKLFIDPVGVITYDNNTLMTSFGPFTETFIGPVLIDSTGKLTTPVDPLTYHGQLSAGKDLYIRTRTSGPSSYNLLISVAVK